MLLFGIRAVLEELPVSNNWALGVTSSEAENGRGGEVALAAMAHVATGKAMVGGRFWGTPSTVTPRLVKACIPFMAPEPAVRSSKFVRKSAYQSWGRFWSAPMFVSRFKSACSAIRLVSPPKAARSLKRLLRKPRALSRVKLCGKSEFPIA